MMVRSSFHPLNCCFTHLLLTEFINFCKAGQIGASGPKDRRVACVALYSARDLNAGHEFAGQNRTITRSAVPAQLAGTMRRAYYGAVAW